MPKFRTINALFGSFWVRTLKNYFAIRNQHPQISLIAKFCEQTKMLKFGTKNALFGFLSFCLWFLFLFIFEINTVKFVKLQNFGKKQKWLNMGPKMLYLVIVGLEFWKAFVLLEFSTLQFVKLKKFAKRMPKFAIKDALFGYLCARTLKSYFHIWNQHPQICVTGKF